MLYIYMILIALLCFNCSEAPLEIPLDSNRNVNFNVNMSNFNFYSPDDSIKLHIDNNVYDMSNSDDDNIFSLTLNLILGKEYLYKYSVNDSLENLVNYRSIVVTDSENVVSDFYSEINPTILIFFVDMSYQIELGNFNPEIQYLDVAGTFNNWGENPVTLNSIDDIIYQTIFTDFSVDDSIQFKFRIDGENWESPNPEISNCILADFGYNRFHIVEDGEKILEFCFNDEGCN